MIFMAGLSEHFPDKIYFEIFDGRTTGGDTLLYRFGGVRPEAACLFEKKSEQELFGRTWTLHFKTLPDFEIAIDRSRQLYITFTGLFSSFLLFGITFLIVSRSKRLAAEIIIREREQEALRESEQRYRSIMDQAADAIFINDETGRIIDINQSACQSLGYTRDELLALTIADIDPDAFRSGPPRLWGKALAGAQIIIEINQRRKDGSTFPAEMKVGLVSLSAGPAVLSIVRDITERKKADDALKAIAAHENALLSAIPDIVMEVNTHKVYTWANYQGINFFGDDVIGHEAAFYFVGEQDTYRLVEPLFLGEEDSVYVESWQQRWDGQKRLLAWWSHVIKDSWGNVQGAISSARDITEQIKATEEIIMASTKWRGTFDAVLDPLALLSADGSVGQCNKAFVEFLGLDFPAVVGRKCHQLIHGTEKPIAGCPVVKARESGVRETMELKVGEKMFLVVADPVKDPDGTVIGFVHIMRDITERNMAEKAIIQERDFIQAIIESVPGLFFVCNQRLGFQRWNLNFERAFGHSAEEISNRSFMDIFTKSADDILGVAYSQVARTGEFNFEADVLTIEQTRIPYIFTGKLFVFRGEGSMLAIGIDISDRVQAEQALQEKSAEIERFTYSVSHDLRSPLVTIRTFLGHLGEDIVHRDAKSIDEDMGYIKNASQKMVDLLDELLQLSRIGRMMNPSVETPFQDLVREASDLVAGQIQERGAQVHINDDRVLLYGDRNRLIEVFQNLLDNAVKYMGDQSDPRIVIGAEYKNGDVLVYVRDNGMGIDLLNQDKLFNVFERLNLELKGAGLGLTLVKRIVEIHGGKVWVESGGLGKGACFWFSLPRKDVQG